MSTGPFSATVERVEDYDPIRMRETLYWVVRFGPDGAYRKITRTRREALEFCAERNLTPQIVG